MRRSLQRLAFAAAGILLLVGCSSTDIQQTTRAGLLIAGEDQTRADQISRSAGQLAGSMAPMPYDTERAIGGSIAIESLATQGGLYPDEDLQRYVNKVGLAISRQTPRRGFPFSFAVVNDEKVNAWAAPGDYIFITAGALRAMRDESELAGVLAHEIAHSTSGHMVRMMRRGQFFQGAIGAAQALDDNAQQYTQAVDFGTDVLFNKGLDRDMEYEADLLGIEYAALTGYDPNGLLRYLDRLRQTQGESGGGWLSSTHPPLSDRLERLRAKMRTDLAGYEGARAQDRFNKQVTAALNR